MEWRVSRDLVDYDEAIRAMEERVAAIETGQAPELMWLLEHPPLFTSGTSAAPDEFPVETGIPVYPTGRGGRVTWHGPGQRVIYAMIDLRRRGRDIRHHIRSLEAWVIRALGDFGITGECREGRIGIWVNSPNGEEKIAAIGVRVRRWITFHGLALNVHPDLDDFNRIVPCGLRDYGVTSMQALGVSATLEEIDAAFQKHLAAIWPD